MSDVLLEDRFVRGYHYAKKTVNFIWESAFVKENGEMTDDPAEQAEILRKQYESAASKPFDCFKVDENFFGDKTEEPLEGEVIETCKTDMSHSQMLGKFEYGLPAKF